MKLRVDAPRPGRKGSEERVEGVFGEREERSFSEAFSNTKLSSEEAGFCSCTFTRDVDEFEGTGRIKGREGFCGCEGVVVCYFDIFPIIAEVLALFYVGHVGMRRGKGATYSLPTAVCEIPCAHTTPSAPLSWFKTSLL